MEAPVEAAPPVTAAESAELERLGEPAELLLPPGAAGAALDPEAVGAAPDADAEAVGAAPDTEAEAGADAPGASAKRAAGENVLQLELAGVRTVNGMVVIGPSDSSGCQYVTV